MAITATGTVLSTAAILPDGYTIPTLPALTSEADGEYTVDIAITEADPADATIGLDNVISAVEADFETTQSVTIGLNAALTINVNATIRTIQRLNTQGVEDGGIFITGTEVFRCYVTYDYEVV